MIITRTPFRVSFAGGGSDLPGYYAQRAYGAVLSAAVKHYMYVVIHPYFQDKIRIKYSQTEDVTRIDDIRHPIVRECLRKVQIRRGIEIASFADVPAGTGLGSSSAFTVGLLNALYAFKGELKSKHELAQEACEIEIDILKEPIGKQDQYAAAYGGLNYIRFNKDESVTIERILIDKDKKKQLESKLKLYYTGDTRSASKILKQQGKNLASNKALTSTDKLVSLADTLKAGLCQGKIDQIGKVLHQGWQLKQQLAEGITNTSLNKQYERFLNKGASGGKLLGAGGAGFFLVYADSHDQFDMRTNRTLPFAIDDEGSRILFYDA